MLKKFSVKSSLGSQFNCTGLNGLRKAGVLKGEYSCQNQTVADESGAARCGKGAGISLLLSVVVVGVFIRDFVMF